MPDRNHPSDRPNQAERPISTGRTLQLILGAMLVALAIAIAFYMIQGVQALLKTSASAGVQRDRAVELSELLVECTTAPELRNPPVKPEDVKPDDCYQRQQKATASFTAPDGALGSLISAGAACGAIHPGDYKATRECTVKVLRRNAPAR